MNAVARAFAPPLYFTDPRARPVDIYREFRWIELHVRVQRSETRMQLVQSCIM